MRLQIIGLLTVIDIAFRYVSQTNRDFNMVGLSVVSENFLNIMPRSKTSAHVKMSSQRRSSLQPRSPYFWNAGQETPRKSTGTTGKTTNAERLSYRRKSTGETYKIWDLGENGMKNIQLIEMSENQGGNGRQKNHLLPPISSLRNPRLLSATPSTRSERKRNKRSSTTIGGSRHSSNHSKSNKSISNTSHKLLLSERSNTENFCHGLPRGGKEDKSNQFIDSNEPMTSRTTIASSIRSKLEDTKPILSSYGIKPRASSLRSQPSSSDGSITSAAFRARIASRRFSLPVTPSVPQSLLPRKSKESSKAIELSSGTHLSSGDKKSPKTRSLLTSSEKFSSPASSTVAREAPVTTHGDGLHIIEETPAEPSTPVLATQWDKISEVKENKEDRNTVTIVGDKEVDTASNKTSKLSNAWSVNIASEDYKNALTSLNFSEQNQAIKFDDIPEIAVTPSAESLTDIAAVKGIEQLDINNNNNNNNNNRNDNGEISEQVLGPTLFPTQKAELLTSSSMFGDDESVIDAAILKERDEDLCDADFREKRIIQWIIAADTGYNVEQQVESAISPSPTNGSRETAITVIYGE